MLYLSQAVVVEGKYDKIKLSSILDAVILVTNGFHIFKDTQKLELIRHYARTTGIVILTDSDAAGFQIRSFLKGAIHEGQIYHVYPPDVYGKERRKEKSSAEGKLGVEGIEKKLLLEAFQKAGILAEDSNKKLPPVSSDAQDTITRCDLFELKLTGSPDSKARRKALQKYLRLPDLLSTSSLLEVLNTMMTREELIQMMKNAEN